MRVHDLSHPFCSALAERGLLRLAIARQAGHDSAAVTDRYSHLNPEESRETAKPREAVGAPVVASGRNPSATAASDLPGNQLRNSGLSQRGEGLERAERGGGLAC